MKNTTQHPLKQKWTVSIDNGGNFIRHKWVKIYMDLHMEPPWVVGHKFLQMIFGHTIKMATTLKNGKLSKNLLLNQ